MFDVKLVCNVMYVNTSCNLISFRSGKHHYISLSTFVGNLRDMVICEGRYHVLSWYWSFCATFFSVSHFCCCCCCCSHCGFYDEWKANCAVKKMILKQGLYRIDVIFFCATVSARDQNHGNVNTKAKLWVKFFFSLLFLYHSDWYSCNLLIFGEE